ERRERRQAAVETRSHYGRADKTGGRHSVSVPAASPAIGVEEPVSAADDGCIPQAVGKPYARSEVVRILVPVSSRQATDSRVHRPSVDNRAIRQGSRTGIVEIRELILALRARRLVVISDSEIQCQPGREFVFVLKVTAIVRLREERMKLVGIVISAG